FRLERFVRYDTRMNRAFIFDMDGVLVDSEKAWELYEPPMIEKMFGKQLADEVSTKIGLGLQGVHELIQKRGHSISIEKLAKAYEGITPGVYGHSPITP